MKFQVQTLERSTALEAEEPERVKGN